MSAFVFWTVARRHLPARYRFGAIAALPALSPELALAHATEQPFVLLLPTRLYMAAGVAAVLLTLLLLAIPRIGQLTGNWNGYRLRIRGENRRAAGDPVRARRVQKVKSARIWEIWTSSLSFVLFALLVLIGLFGPTDPAANLLPLILWMVWWIVLVMAQAVLGDIWRWVNPWSGPYSIVRRLFGLAPPVRLPTRLGHVPGYALLVLFAIFLTADLAPSDPRRLSILASFYWLFSFAGMLFCGGSWLRRGEFITVLMRRFAALAPFACRPGGVYLGVPGWQILRGRSGVTLGLFTIALLGIGSFESLYKTFWWFSFIGINPLEFPGRSAVITSTIAGLLASLILASVIFAAVVAAGLASVREMPRLREAFRRQAQCLMPIVAGYHIAHYLTSLLVEGQYLYVALGDPFATGADLLGIGSHHVTTGFLQTREGARTIWLCQAGAVVLGHVLAILVSHAVAFDMFKDHRKATASQIPISAFMVLYTFFGLWLLASPRGM